MKMKLIPILLLCCSVVSGCKNKNPNIGKEELMAELAKEEEKIPEKVFEIPPGYIPPAGIAHNAIVEKSGSFRRFDMQDVLKNERPVKLSDFGKEVKYYLIKNSPVHLREIIPVKNGYLALLAPGFFLLDENFNKVKELITEDVTIEPFNDSFMFHLRTYFKSIIYDEENELIHFIVIISPSQKDEKGKQYRGYISVNDLLQLTEPIKPQDIKNLIANDGYTQSLIPVKGGYGTTERLKTSLYTFNAKGDTLCYFNLSIEPEKPFTGSTMRGAESSTLYTYNGNIHYRPAYTNIIFRIKNPYTFEQIYQIDFGNKQVSPSDGPKPSVSLADKMLLHNWTETDNYIFMCFTQDYDCPNTRSSGSVKFHQAFFNKATKEFFSFTDTKNISKPYYITNDIDNGPGFWPDQQINGKPFRTIRAKEYKEFIKATPTHQVAFPDITDDDIVLMTIN